MWGGKGGGGEDVKEQLRGRELGMESMASMERNFFRSEKYAEGAEERLRKREDVVEGKERSIFVRIDEAEKRREETR